MKEYRYRNYEEPILVTDDGNATYKNKEVRKYQHEYKVVGMASGFSFNQLAKQHYLSEIIRIEREIKTEENRKNNPQDYDNFETADDFMNAMFESKGGY